MSEKTTPTAPRPVSISGYSSVLTTERIDKLFIQLESDKRNAIQDINMNALRAYWAMLHSLFTYLNSSRKFQDALKNENLNFNFEEVLRSTWDEIVALTVETETSDFNYSKYLDVLSKLTQIDEAIKFVYQDKARYFFTIYEDKTTLLDDAEETLAKLDMSESMKKEYYSTLKDDETQEQSPEESKDILEDQQEEEKENEEVEGDESADSQDNAE